MQIKPFRLLLSKREKLKIKVSLMLEANSPVQGKDHNLFWKPLHYVSPILESYPGILHDIRDSLRATSSRSTVGLRVRGALQSGQRRRERKLK